LNAGDEDALWLSGRLFHRLTGVAAAAAAPEPGRPPAPPGAGTSPVPPPAAGNPFRVPPGGADVVSPCGPGFTGMVLTANLLAEITRDRST
jgi:hypothetical protein